MPKRSATSFAGSCRAAAPAFPHLYGDLPLSAVREVWPLPLSPDGHIFPGGHSMTIADRATGLLRLLEPERAHRLALRAAAHEPLPSALSDA